MKKCVFAGTFDPFTNGHKDIVERCITLFDKVFIVVGENPSKVPLFDIETRLAAIRAEYDGNPAVCVTAYSQTDDYARFLKDNGITAYVRGIRDERDLAYERQFEAQNKKLYPDVQTVYLFAEGQKGVSSTLVRSLLQEGKDVANLIPPRAYAVFFADKPTRF